MYYDNTLGVKSYSATSDRHHGLTFHRVEFTGDTPDGKRQAQCTLELTAEEALVEGHAMLAWAYQEMRK